MSKSTDPEKEAYNTRAQVEQAPRPSTTSTRSGSIHSGSIHSGSIHPGSIHSDSTHLGPNHDLDVEKAAPRDNVEPAILTGEPSDFKAGADAGAASRPSRSRSRASSTRSRPLTIVPRAERRGIFGRFAIVPEVERPYDYKTSTKWGITATIAGATAAAPLGSSIFYPALETLTTDLHTTETITNLSVALYMLSMSIFPIWWSSFSEIFGRRTIYLISFALFVVFSILSAVSVNISMLIVFRMLGGGASASVQAVGAGTIADIWEPRERGLAMSMFYLGPLVGPLIAPIVGGALSQSLGWKSTMYFLAIYGLITLVLIFFLLPETLARPRVDEAAETVQLRRMTTTESVKVHSKKFAVGVKRYLVEPLGVVLLLRFPPVLITVLLASIAFGALFVVNISIQKQFALAPYHFKEIIVGLMYLPSGLGYFVGSFVGGRWIDKIMAREAKKANRYDDNGKLIYLPEDRMRENIWLATTMYPLSLLWYGWTLKYGEHFMVMAVALFFFGFSSMLVFSVATTMLTEFVRKRSSAGVAVNNFLRNILSCVGTIVAAPWINALGVGYVFTIVSIFCMLASYVGIILLRRNAQTWRKSMDEALKDK